MAETSGLWTTDAAPAGHQVVSYTQALASTMLKIAAACSYSNGVAPGYLDELAPSSTGVNNARIATGGAMVDGKYYNSTANEDFVIANAAAGETRIDRIAVKATWATFTCELTLIAGVSAPAPTAPALTYTAGVEYDVPVCQVLVTDGGVITITNERDFADVVSNGIRPLAVVTSKIDNDAVTNAKIADDQIDSEHYVAGSIDLEHMAANSVDSDQYVDGSIDPIHIANRTRQVLCNMSPWSCGAGNWGYDFEDGNTENLSFAFITPSDFASGGEIKVYGWASGACDVAEVIYVNFGAVNEDRAVHNPDDSDTYTCTVADRVYNVMNLTLTGLAAGDIGHGYYQRNGGDVADTIGGYFFIRSIILEYTADS